MVNPAGHQAPEETPREEGLQSGSALETERAGQSGEGWGKIEMLRKQGVSKCIHVAVRRCAGCEVKLHEMLGNFLASLVAAPVVGHTRDISYPILSWFNQEQPEQICRYYSYRYLLLSLSYNFSDYAIESKRNKEQTPTGKTSGS